MRGTTNGYVTLPSLDQESQGRHWCWLQPYECGNAAWVARGWRRMLDDNMYIYTYTHDIATFVYMYMYMYMIYV